MNVNRISAIFEKDLKDFTKNSMLFFMPLLPIILAVFYSRMGDGEDLPLFVIYLIVGVTYSAVTAGFMMMMMAEEREKNTLRGLTLSPASFIEIIIGKSLVTTLLTFASLIIALLIMGIGPLLNAKAMIGLIILFFFFLFLGIGVGLFVKTVGMTTAYMMPLMFLFGFTPMVESLQFEEGSMVLKIFATFPISQMIKLGEDGSWSHIGIVSLWTLGAIAFTYICYIRTRKDS
ncbi:ABC transporter permease [Ornithinibacillus gellani]|uniref:ABC transporter permease n=1 Tax=Ornithinibacillus gellani TaxID=2293253 RepID=UPI000F479F85|nr:ABC transporter permease [Ornithinibacillus gellani]TQS76469.1 ABC transporter permease [Ornithinibacillus gellani]